jgi:hypothetical protein
MSHIEAPLSRNSDVLCTSQSRWSVVETADWLRKYGNVWSQPRSSFLFLYSTHIVCNISLPSTLAYFSTLTLHQLQLNRGSRDCARSEFTFKGLLITGSFTTTPIQDGERKGGSTPVEPHPSQGYSYATSGRSAVGVYL